MMMMGSLSTMKHSGHTIVNTPPSSKRRRLALIYFSALAYDVPLVPLVPVGQNARA
eukprot:COSAG02_NODE_6307_length_3665_cov_3.765564_1_plen_56_part_00